MSTTKISPNMNMVLPVPGQEPGPDYANDITNALNDVVDAHDHSSGKGLKITPVGININSDLSMQGNNLNLPRAVRFQNNTSTLSGVGDINCVYSDGGNLYFNNGTGAAVQVTAGSALNSAALVNNAYSFLAVSGNHTISSADTTVIFSNDTSSTIVYTLPRANAVAKGRLYILKDETGHSQTNNITINTVSGDTIDSGGTSTTIASNFGSVWLISDGVSNWVILFEYKGVTGDLSGSLPSPTVVAIQGKTVTAQTLGFAQDGYALEWSNADGYWKGKQITTGGDLAGPAISASVIKANGASIPASGSLTTGNVLQVSGAAALSYAPINLAGGSNFITGALPIGNQASQSLGGDLSGTTAAATVIKIQGNALQSGVLGSTQDGYVLSWNNGSSQWQAANLATGGIVVLTGDVTGNSNTTTVAKIHGTSVPATPAANQVLVATSTTASTWQQIVDAQISASAAIAGTKISPNFGSQNVVTTGASNSFGNTTISGLTISSGTNLQLGSGSILAWAGGVLDATGTVIKYKQVSKTHSDTPYQCSTVDYTVFVDPSAGIVTVNLPVVSGNTGRIIVVKNTTTFTTHITIATTDGASVDNAASIFIGTSLGFRVLQTDGLNWWTIATA